MTAAEDFHIAMRDWLAAAPDLPDPSQTDAEDCWDDLVARLAAAAIVLRERADSLAECAMLSAIAGALARRPVLDRFAKEWNARLAESADE